MATYQSKLLTELIVKSQSGDKDAVREFFLAISPLIRAITAKKVFNKNEVDDVSQNILISIHSSLNTYDAKRDPLPWIKTIAYRKIIDYIRKNTKIVDNEVFTEDGDVTIFEDPTNTYIESSDLLDGLTPELKDPIRLTKLEGHSTKEAAKILDISESALRTRVSRGLAKLRQTITEENANGGRNE